MKLWKWIKIFKIQEMLKRIKKIESTFFFLSSFCEMIDYVAPLCCWATMCVSLVVIIFPAFSAEFHFNEHLSFLLEDLTAWKLSSKISRLISTSSWDWKYLLGSAETFTRFASSHLIQSHYPRLDFAISLRLVLSLHPIFIFSHRLLEWKINICYNSHHLNINQWSISMVSQLENRWR